jgi:hypothetical protein
VELDENGEPKAVKVQISNEKSKALYNPKR